MSSGNFMTTIEKLNGRENFITWQFAVQAYLEHEGLWECVLGNEDDAEKNIKAKSKLILLVQPTNYFHIRKCTTPKEVWTKLQSAFEDSGLCRKVALIRVLTSTKLQDCKNVEHYVNTIMTASHKLNDIGANVSDDWVGTFLLAGLPDTYHPMIMAIESSGQLTSSDYIKTKLLQDVKELGSASDTSKALISSKGKKPATNKKHHNNSTSSSNVSNRPISEILIANNSFMSVNSIGQVSVVVDRDGENCSVPISNVLHVPDLAMNLLSLKLGNKTIIPDDKDSSNNIL
ncbi:hypothetical protein Bhyg_06471 [Pseudolycoriella hygida]|uniref:Retrovirus-related Pol polyprotein from transposon TNT 1-94-like beta-barrel domain-containing protein n=1 Tax=Pseudolycoriella hygida TaxID=35572 RepID=A0A9Q0S109_9DIPT|nr:hypothetical protein Bhyg_06471 [Pseudolycoriella hygida]